MQDSISKNDNSKMSARTARNRHAHNRKASPSQANKQAKPQPPQNWRKHYINLVILLAIFWLLPASWVALSPPFSRPFFAAATTHQRLLDINAIIQNFRKKHNAIPKDFATIRAYALGEKLPYNGYDSFGQRLDYLRLSDRHYLVRSFGADGVQNTFNSAPDLGITQWGPRTSASPIYQYNKSATLNYFPAVLLDGSDSPNRQWLAKLFVDVGSQTRQLVIRHRTRKGLFMVASHDQVEEFLWLPNGEQIVYTASGSARHRDGLYLWNLANDETSNLLDVVADALVITPAARDNGVFLSLAGVTAATSNKPATVYAFFNLRSDGPMSPETFFVRDQILAFTIPEPSVSKKDTPRFLGKGASGLDELQSAPLLRSLNLKANIELGSGLRHQQEWLALPSSGDIESVLVAWQNYIDKQPSSPLIPYALWILAAFYNESYAIMAAQRLADAEVIRTYGTEVARALIHYPTAPTYLRALGLDLYETLMGGRFVHQRLGQLQLAGGNPINSAPNLHVPTTTKATPGSKAALQAQPTDHNN